MKKIISLALALGLAAAPAFAGSTVTVPMTATVGAKLELSATVYKNSIAPANVVSTMNFGPLVSDTPNGAMRGTDAFQVLLTANSSSRKYMIKQTAAALTNAALNTLIAGACIVTPYANGTALPTGSVLGTRGSFVATDKPLYTSETAGSLQTIGAAYAIANDPANGATQFIPADQPAGTYNSSVTFTLVLV
jgi:hypothetical protein